MPLINRQFQDIMLTYCIRKPPPPRNLALAISSPRRALLLWWVPALSCGHRRFAWDSLSLGSPGAAFAPASTPVSAPLGLPCGLVWFSQISSWGVGFLSCCWGGWAGRTFLSQPAGQPPETSPPATFPVTGVSPELPFSLFSAQKVPTSWLVGLVVPSSAGGGQL